MSDDDAPATAGSSQRRNLQLSSVLGLVVGVVACAFVAKTLASEWSEVREAISHAAPGWLVVGFLCAACAMTGIALGWTDVLGLLGEHIKRTRVLAWYYVGELGKYLPGGVWPVVGRGELARRGGVPRPRAYASVGLSLATLYLAAMFTAVLLLPFSLAGGGDLGAEVLILLLLPIGLAALHPRVLEPLAAKVRKVTKRDLPVPIPPWRSTVVVVLRYIPTWLFVGAATWCVARAIDPHAPISRIAFAAVLSWIAGFVAVPVPAGAGVREAVFIAASGLTHVDGATVAVATRVLFIIVDGGGAALATPFIRRRGGLDAAVDDGESAASDELDGVDPIGPLPT